ncbi:MAG: ABC transporter ATP-binding protein [Clostridia bacterium]|nr:ABC transporter ATP-binding protein [Clostridia bacterium]
MIRIRELEKKYPPDFTLRIGEAQILPGDRVALIGMNGSGKSTLLRLLAGLEKPDRGELICIVPRERIGYQPQSPYVFRGTAAYNLGLAPRAPKHPEALLSVLELDALAEKKMNALSGGEKQRVFLGRMLAGDFDLLLLDEPMSAADLQTGAHLSRVLKEYCDSRGTTLVFSTHLPRQAFDIATKVMLLDRGTVAEFGGVGQLRAPRSEFGKQFFAQWNL